MKNILKQITTHKKEDYLKVIVFIIVGMLLAFTLRFVLVEKPGVHYHANFQVYINDQRFKFDNFTYYEEVQVCYGDSLSNPKTRVHLHNNEADVVHVHDYAVTWGHLLQNLSMSATAKALELEGKLYPVDDSNKLTFILNGKEIENPTNYVIASEDALLINYGTKNLNQAMERYAAIPKTAAEYNRKQDPSSCTGSNHEPFLDRVKRTIGIKTTN